MHRIATGESEFDAAFSLDGATMHLVHGRDSIVGMQRVLADLSARCGQTGVMDDAAYFLSKPGALKRVPHLLLVSKTAQLDWNQVIADDLIGAVLLYKYAVLGLGIGAFTTNDRSGRGTLVAPAALRLELAERVSKQLIEAGAWAVMISFCEEVSAGMNPSTQHNSLLDHSSGGDKIARWARREREIPGYLPLEKTYDATLARIGQRTRSNLRYYRRRAENQLGCTFVPAVTMEKTEFLAFNRDSMYAVSDTVAGWKFDSLKDVGEPLFMGIKDRDGRWLSLLGGRRRHDGTEILWQFNRDGLEVYSLSLVMRSYFIEHEIAHGMQRLYIEGGTPHPMRFSFVKQKVTDLVFLRKTRLSSIIRSIAKHVIKQDNDLAQMLLDPTLYESSTTRRISSAEPQADSIRH